MDSVAPSAATSTVTAAAGGLGGAESGTADRRWSTLGHGGAYKVRHMPALDGARGIFVILGPVIYHLRPDLLPGGVLSLDLFFVLSSFLIIRLLLAEWDRSGTINMKAYAGRRARRLLPALIPTLGVLAVYLAVFGTPSIVNKWAAGIASSLTYMMNWFEIWRGNSYWDAQTAESPVRHLWSFAVEEQFYLFAPLFLIFCLRRFQARAGRIMLWVSGVATLASAAWMSHLYVPDTDPSRVYYGTDTRAHTIFIGIILAILVHLWGPIRTAKGRVAANVAGVLSVLVFSVMLVKVGGQSNWMFEYGGFVLVSLLSCGVVFACAQPTSWIHPIFANPVAMGIGVMSYGVYLFHQPINLLLTSDRAHLGGWPLDLLRFGLTLALAYVSFHFYERRMAKSHLFDGAKGLAWSLGGIAAVLGILLFSVLRVPSSSVTQQIVIGEDATSSGPPVFEGLPLVDRPLRVLVVGDSVMAQIGAQLTRYAVDHPEELVVLNKARIGCGISQASEQRYTDPDGTERQGPTDPICATWPTKVSPNDLGDPNQLAWPTAVEWFVPDVVLMYPSPWDATDRKIPEIGTDWTFPGEPPYDEYLSTQFKTGITDLTKGGAQLLWLTAPELGGGRSDQVQSSPARIARINELYQQVVGEANVDNRKVDYAEWLGPVGSEHETAAREDGVHLSPDALAEFTDRLLKSYLLNR